MASFMQTMFVAPSPPSHTRPSLLSPHTSSSSTSSATSRCQHHYPCAAKPLSPLACHISAVWPQFVSHAAPQSQLEKYFRPGPPPPPPVKVRSDPSPESSGSDESPTVAAAAGHGSPARRERVALPRSKAGRQQRAADQPAERNDVSSHAEREREEHGAGMGHLHGLGYGLEALDINADLLTARSFDDYSNANARTRAQFKPQRSNKGSNAYQLKQFAEATLGHGSLKKVVMLPEGEDRDEWLAVNIVDFYNQINLLYGAITEFCSPQTCPEMKATEEFEYLWHDPPTYPKPTRLPAPKYISNLLTWTSDRISNPSLFPTQPGVPFPAKFQDTVRQIFKRLYRVYAHIYCHHYSVVRGLGLEAHLNTGFKHYVLFVEEFGLAVKEGEGRREWFGPLGELVESMVRSD